MHRLWTATAAMVVCLALGGVPALAQEASPPASPSASRAMVEMAPAVFTGEDTGSSWVASDPRFSGTFSTTWDAQVQIPYGSAKNSHHGSKKAKVRLPDSSPRPAQAGPVPRGAGLFSCRRMIAATSSQASVTSIWSRGRWPAFTTSDS
jgi:hypothetical protein